MRQLDPPVVTESPPERVLLLRPRMVLQAVLIAIAAIALTGLILDVKRVLIWIAIALFLALALNPAVEGLVVSGMRRGTAVALVFCGAVLVVGGFLALLVPPLVAQVRDFIEAVPGLVRDLTEGRGPLGRLERDYQISARIQQTIEGTGGGGLGVTEPVIDVAQGVVTFIFGTITVAVLTLFMLLEGPRWVRAALDAIPEPVRPRWERAAQGVYRTVGGYVAGNLLISVIAGGSAIVALWLAGVPYAVPLGILVALLDLIPLAGATIAAVLVSGVAFTQGVVPGLVIVVFFVIYQQLENHLLQPLVYGRVVQLSPLGVLISVLIGAELAGVVGALGAIPVAASLGIIVREVREHRADRRAAAMAAGIAPEP